MAVYSTSPTAKITTLSYRPTQVVQLYRQAKQARQEVDSQGRRAAGQLDKLRCFLLNLTVVRTEGQKARNHMKSLVKTSRKIILEPMLIYRSKYKGILL